MRKVKVIGGFGEKKSNRGTQWYLQDRIYDTEGISTALSSFKSDYWIFIRKEDNMDNKRKIEKVGNISPSGHHNGDVYSTKGISRTVCARDWKDPVKIIENKEDDRSIKKVGNYSPSNHHGKNVYSDKGLSPTLCGQSVYKNGLNIQTDEKDQEFRIRKLTPLECERLQAFPDNWTKYGKDGEIISNTQRYKCCGNAVTTTVITWIADEMFKNLTEEEKKELDL